MGSPVTPTDNISQTQEPPIRSNHARSMRYDHGARSHNTCLQQECQRPPQQTLPGQTLNSKLGFFQPSRTCIKLGLTLEATPLIEVSYRAVYVLFNNCTAQDIHVPKANHLGWLIKSSQVELYCHSATCGDIQWNDMSCLTGPRCYINTDIQHHKHIHN